MKKGNKNLIIGIVTVAVIFVVYLFYISGPQISAIGNSELTVKPDMISVYATSQVRNTSSSFAQEKVIELSDKFVLELEKIGITEEDIELSNYNVYEDFDWSSSSRKSLGFIASQSITVKLIDFDKTSQVIKAATNAGITISGINYELSIDKQNEYKAEAMKKAGIDARTKATALASGFNRGLGRLVSVQSNDYGYRPYPLFAKSAEGGVADSNVQAETAVSSMSPSDLTVTANVEATYSMTRF